MTSTANGSSLTARLPGLFRLATSVATAEDYILFIAFAGYVGGDDASKQQYVNKIKALLNEANNLLQSTQEPTAETVALWRKNGVILEVGHDISPPAIALIPVRSGSPEELIRTQQTRRLRGPTGDLPGMCALLCHR